MAASKLAELRVRASSTSHGNLITLLHSGKLKIYMSIKICVAKCLICHNSIFYINIYYFPLEGVLVIWQIGGLFISTNHVRK